MWVSGNGSSGNGSAGETLREGKLAEGSEREAAVDGKDESPFREAGGTTGEEKRRATPEMTPSNTAQARPGEDRDQGQMSGAR